MELTELRTQIDEIDRALIALLERRMDVSADIADYKLLHGKAILDEKREQEKLRSVRAQCRPETAELIAGVFASVMAASRGYQQAKTEARHG